MPTLPLTNLICIDCKSTIKTEDVYTQHEKTEAQIRAGYRCYHCQRQRVNKYRNRRI